MQRCEKIQKYILLILLTKPYKLLLNWSQHNSYETSHKPYEMFFQKNQPPKNQIFKIFQKFSNIIVKNIIISALKMLRHQNINLFPNFSVRLKKIIFRNPKMDIFKMSKNVQKRNLMGSLK